MGTNTETVNGATKTSTVNGPNAGPSLFVAPPANGTSPGALGMWSTDGTYLYIWTATNVVKRITLDLIP